MILTIGLDWRALGHGRALTVGDRHHALAEPLAPALIITVRYHGMSRLLQHISFAHFSGSCPKLLGTFSRIQLLVLNHWLGDPLIRSQSQDLLEILDDHYGRTSTMVVTPVPADRWHSRFPDLTLGDAILDWLVHCAYRFEWVGPQVTAQS